jgi:hypothetical protein
VEQPEDREGCRTGGGGERGSGGQDPGCRERDEVKRALRREEEGKDIERAV